MKKLFTLIFCAGFYSLALGQNPGGGTPAQEPATPKGNAKVSGAVVDSENNQPVEFANVALLDPATGKPVDGSVCDDKGKFLINKVVEGTYDIAVSFIGYETQTIKGIVVEKRAEVNLGLIKLSTGAKVLNEVVVEGQKQLIEERVDRTIYNAENDQTTRGGDATDVLKRVPMLSVDLDGNVTLRGSQNITVLINNKPSTIMASSISDALKQIPADQIKTVEVITSPSAKYDAEGSGGIINIVTKKNTLQGATLNIDAGVGTRGSNLGLNGNYRKGKMGFSLGGWGRSMYNVTGSFDNSQLTNKNGAEQYLNVQSADTRSHGLFGNYTLGWDYDIDKKNSLAASVRFGARNNKSYQDDLYSQFFINSLLDSTTLRNSVTNDLSNTVDLNLTYTHLYEKPQKEFSMMASYSKNNRNNDFENRTIAVNDTDYFAGYKNLNDSYNQEVTVQADFQTPLSTNQILELGGKDIMRKAVSNFTYFNDPDGDYIYEASAQGQLTNNLNYDQNIVAGYLAYTLSLQKGYSIKAGSRYEYTSITAYTKTESNIEIPSYGVFVPSVNVSKKLKTGTVKIAYNRRIQRPSIQFLNPNVQSSNPTSISSGNPQLDPEYSNNYELSYSTFIKGTSLNFSTYMRNTTGAIQRVRDTTEIKGQILTTFQNIGTEDTYGFNVFANVNIGKLSLNGGPELYYAVLDNNLAGDYRSKNEGWVISGRLFGSYALQNGWGLQLFSFYRGRNVQLQGSQGGFGIYSLGVKKDFKDKKGSVGFGAENFFTPHFRIHNDLSSNLIEQKGLNIMNNMSFRINISYRIGKMNVDGASRPKRRRSIDNDDLKDGGDGGGGMEGGGGGNGGGRSGGGGAAPAGGAATKKAEASKLPPADPTAVVKADGKWTYTIESPQGGEGVLFIKKEGDNSYTGTITNKRFNTETALSSVTVSGNELSFQYSISRQDGNQMSVQVKSIITGDALSGDMTVGQFGTFPLKATRTQE